MAFTTEEQQRALGEIGDILIQAVRDKMASENVNASGNLSDSLSKEVIDGGVRIWADGYFPYAEVGRPSGGIPYDFASILAKWVEDKGISVPSQFMDSYEFGQAIAHNIKNYGSSRYRKSTPVDLISDAVEEVMPEVEDILGKVFVKTINDSLQF